MSIINESNLAHYLKLGYNVLFRGRHGVGKTAIIKKVFESAGLNYLYLSASTLDPWVDFVGVPKIIERDGKAPVLDLVRRQMFADDEIEAVFIDEYNRAHDKIINATMELIQFKSINGHKLNNLKVIWVAINPEDDEDTYSVNHLDPAHIDRFQVHIDVPFKVDSDYFLAKYPETGSAFIDWWKGLPQDIRYEVSPRRLDYAADAHQNKCRLEDFLPVKSNVKALRDLIKKRPFLDRISKIADEKEAVEFLRDANNTMTMLDLLTAEESTAKSFFKKYAAHIPKELAAPFVECLKAKKLDVTDFSNLEEFIEKIPGDRGTTDTVALINSIDLHGWYPNATDDELMVKLLSSELRLLKMNKQNLVAKLALRFSDVLSIATLDNIKYYFFGLNGASTRNMCLIYIALMETHAFADTTEKKLHEKLRPIFMAHAANTWNFNI